jgi:hypothetical protein
MASSQAVQQQLAAQIAQNNPNDPTSYLSPNIIGDFNDLTLDGSGYGSLTGAGQLQTYYAYYNAITSTAPEIPDQTAYFVKYLIDKDGNVVKPQPGEISSINLKDNFEPGKIATATSRVPTVTFSDLLGDKLITHVGEISTILVSNTGSAPGAYVTTMSFEDITGVNLDTFPFDYNFSIRNIGASSDPWGAGIPAQLLNYGTLGRTFASSTGFSLVTNTPDPSAATWDGNKYTFVESTSNSNRVRFYFSMNLQVFRVREAKVGGNRTVQNDSYAAVDIKYIVQRYSDGVVLSSSPWITVTNQSNNQYPEWSSPYLSFQAGDEIKFGILFAQDGLTETSDNAAYRFYNNNLGAYTQGTNPSGTGLIQVINENNNFSGYEVNGINMATAPYWHIGGYPTDPSAVYTQATIITASLGMAQLYRPNMIYSLHPSCAAYGYSRPWQTYYKLLPGDKIIFENNKNSTHTIYEIIESNISTPEGSASFGLKVFPGIVSGTNLDNFCIYRIIDNGTYIILNQTKPNISGSLQGFLTPKYITQELSDSIKDTTYRLDVDGLLDQ